MSNEEMDLLTVYVKPGCPWCVEVIEHLEMEGYAYEEIDVVSDRSAFAEMRRLSGQTKAPTVTYGEQVLADCGVAELRPFLARHVDR